MSRTVAVCLTLLLAFEIACRPVEVAESPLERGGVAPVAEAHAPKGHVVLDSRQTHRVRRVLHLGLAVQQREDAVGQVGRIPARLVVTRRSV